MPPPQSAYGPVSTPPLGGNYDFILNSNRGSSPDLLARLPMRNRIVVVCGGFAILILAAWMLFSIINGKPGTAPQLVRLAQQQQELARISDAPGRNATSFAVRDFAATTELSLASEQQTLLKFLNGTGTKLQTQTLAAMVSKTTDDQLKNAQASGTYDETYNSIAKQQLNTYISTLSQAYQNSKTTAERTILKNAYDHAQMLLALSSQTT
jgi:hypothetical protein